MARGSADFIGLLGMHLVGGFLQSTLIGLAAALCAYGVIHLLAAIDASRRARQKAWENRLTMLVVLVFATGFLILRFAPLGAVGGTEFYEISSASNQPTLRPGDLVMVQRAAPAHLKRGDFIAFEYNQSNYMHRIVGLPGDLVQIRLGILHLNGSPVPRTPIDPPAGSQEGGLHYKEALPDGRVHPILETGDDEFGDNTREYVVSDGHLFVLGDNRDNAQDSRWIGPMPFDRVLGQGLYIFSEEFDRLGQLL